MSVVLTVLKILGVVLLGILALVLLLLAVLLLVPVRYAVSGSVGDSVKVSGKAGWLLSAIRYEFSLEDGEVTDGVRIFGFRVRKKAKVTEVELEEDAAEAELAAMELGMEEDARPAKESGSTGQVQEPDKTTGKPGDISEENSSITKSQPDDLQCNSEQKKTGDDRKKDSGKASDKNVLRKIKSLWQTIKELPGIISRQFRKIRRSLQNAKCFAERIHELFADELNQYAVKKIWAQCLYLLGHFRFRKIYTDLMFSLSDPAWTGQALGIFSMIPLFYQYEVHLYPDFESDKLYVQGDFEIKGRIRLIHLVVVTLRLLFDQKVRIFGKRMIAMVQKEDA